ncbi:hypothetical protein G7Y89_g10315 [Cudoniella acicularis]|uniref:Uncharacterized protein n=1 Tax=Cudoniella acicularis TaxID=354080 RepID=A0A8H4RD03_9HELO|nr:hypothetical protein G7Y89_g10315 [Cudoniella acicularis]
MWRTTTLLYSLSRPLAILKGVYITFHNTFRTECPKNGTRINFSILSVADKFPSSTLGVYVVNDGFLVSQYVISKRILVNLILEIYLAQWLHGNSVSQNKEIVPTWQIIRVFGHEGTLAFSCFFGIAPPVVQNLTIIVIDESSRVSILQVIRSFSTIESSTEVIGTTVSKRINSRDGKESAGLSVSPASARGLVFDSTKTSANQTRAIFTVPISISSCSLTSKFRKAQKLFGSHISTVLQESQRVLKTPFPILFTTLAAFSSILFIYYHRLKKITWADPLFPSSAEELSVTRSFPLESDTNGIQYITPELHGSCRYSWFGSRAGSIWIPCKQHFIEQERDKRRQDDSSLSNFRLVKDGIIPNDGVAQCPRVNRKSDMQVVSPSAGVIWAAETPQIITLVESNTVPYIANLESFHTNLLTGDNTVANRSVLHTFGQLNLTNATNSYNSQPLYIQITIPASVGGNGTGYFLGIYSILKADASVTIINFSDRFALQGMNGTLTDAQKAANYLAPQKGPDREFWCNDGTEICSQSEAIGSLTFINSTSTAAATVSSTAFPSGAFPSADNPSPTTTDLPTQTIVFVPGIPENPTQTIDFGSGTSTNGPTNSSPPLEASTGFQAGIAALSTSALLAIIAIVYMIRRRRKKGKGKIPKRSQSESKWWNKIPRPRFGTSELTAGRGQYDTTELPASVRPMYELHAGSIHQSIHHHGVPEVQRREGDHSLEMSGGSGEPLPEDAQWNIAMQMQATIAAPNAPRRAPPKPPSNLREVHSGESNDLIPMLMTQKSPIAVPLPEIRLNEKSLSPPPIPPRPVKRKPKPVVALDTSSVRDSAATSSSNLTTSSIKITPKTSPNEVATAVEEIQRPSPPSRPAPVLQESSSLTEILPKTDAELDGSRNVSAQHLPVETSATLSKPAPALPYRPYRPPPPRPKIIIEAPPEDLKPGSNANSPVSPVSPQEINRHLEPAQNPDAGFSSRRPQLSNEHIVTLRGELPPRNPLLRYASSSSLNSTSSSEPGEANQRPRGQSSREPPAPINTQNSIAIVPDDIDPSIESPSNPSSRHRCPPLSPQQLNSIAPARAFQPPHQHRRLLINFQTKVKTAPQRAES